jgi:hypothetical protein
MRKGRTITVRVSPELYKQTRHLAADYNTTVTELVAYLLERMPRAIARSSFPVGGPKPRSAPAPSAAPSGVRAAPAAIETPLVSLAPPAPPAPPAPLTPLTPPVPLVTPSPLICKDCVPMLYRWKRIISCLFSLASGGTASRNTAGVPLSAIVKRHNMKALRPISK